MLEVGDKVLVTGVIRDTLEGVEVGKVGEIIAIDYSYYTKEPYLVNFGDCKWWAGRDFLVEKLEDVEAGETASEEGIKGAEISHSVNVVKVNGGEDLTVEGVSPVIEEKQDTKESDNTPKEGVYNTIIKKDGLTIYTNYSVEMVGEVMRVGGVDDLVRPFEESEEGWGK